MHLAFSPRPQILRVRSPYGPGGGGDLAGRGHREQWPQLSLTELRRSLGQPSPRPRLPGPDGRSRPLRGWLQDVPAAQLLGNRIAQRFTCQL